MIPFSEHASDTLHLLGPLKPYIVSSRPTSTRCSTFSGRSCDVLYLIGPIQAMHCTFSDHSSDIYHTFSDRSSNILHLLRSFKRRIVLSRAVQARYCTLLGGSCETVYLCRTTRPRYCTFSDGSSEVLYLLTPFKR